MNLFDLTGKVAIVTGGNGGIGLGIAQGLAQAGAKIVVLGRNTEKSQMAAQWLQAQVGADALVVTGDVGRAEDVDRAIAEITKHFGRIDILFNNAGINIRKQPEELSLAEWQEVINTNLTSAFLMSKAVYPAMKKGGGGKIVNIGSMTSIFGCAVRPGLRGQQGGHRPVDQEPGTRLGQGQHPGQRDPPRLVRHRAHGKGPGTNPGPARTRLVSHPPGPMGQAGRHGGHRHLARQPGQRLCHRHRDRRRRRIFVVAVDW